MVKLCSGNKNLSFRVTAMLNYSKKTYLFILKLAVFTVLFISAVYFENAQQQRLIVLIAAFFLLLANNVCKYFTDIEGKRYLIYFFLDLALIYFLEFNSRLLINYFIHLLYIIILLEASITLNIKKGIIVGTSDIVVSMIKFVYLVYFKFNLSSISQLIFFLLVSVLIFIVALFARYSRQEKEKQDVLYRELLSAHKKLKKSAEEVSRLTAVEERNKIARDIHDSLGHNMTALIMQIQMTEHYLDSDYTKSRELLSASLETAKKSLSDIRAVVETLRSSENAVSTNKEIKTLVKDFSKKTGIEIDLKIEGVVVDSPKVSDTLYHIIQEGMTNAVRHGNASKIQITLNYTGSGARFTIKDNGSGAKNIKEGFGMKGIRERAEALNGEVEFDADNGFMIKGFIQRDNKLK